MVARNRSRYLKPLGAKIAHDRNAGFSRIPAEVLTSNRHAGLYAYKLSLRRVKDFENLQEMDKHFVKERKLKNAEMRKLRKAKEQKVMAKLCEKKIAPRASNSYQYCGIHRNRMNGCERVQVRRTAVPEKSAFVPKELKMRHGTVLNRVGLPNKSARTSVGVSCKRVKEKRSKCERLNSTNFDEGDFSILTLRQKFSYASKAYAAEAIANTTFDFTQQKRKLRVMNELIHECNDLTKQFVKARAALISNLTWKQKESVRANTLRLHLKRNCAIKHQELKNSRLPLKNILESCTRIRAKIMAIKVLKREL